MLKQICSSILLLLVIGCQSDGVREGLDQCAGNHSADSIAIWQQRAPDLLALPYVTDVGAHPSRRCLTVGITDSAHTEAVAQALRAAGIPGDAVVLTEVEALP